MRNAVFMAALLSQALTGCGERTSPTSGAPSSPPVVSAGAVVPTPITAAVTAERSEYVFQAGQFGAELLIGSTFHAPAATPVSVANCNGAFSWRLQQRQGAAWIDAWVPSMDACLSAPIRIPAGGQLHGQHLVRSGAGAPLLASPRGFPLAQGSYRLVWDGVSLASGAALSEELRASDTFLVRLPDAPEAANPVAPVGQATQPDTCNARSLQWLLGQKRSRIPPAAEGTAIRVVCSTCPMTMDFSESRLTIVYDEATDIISKLDCG